MADKPQHPPTIELDGARLRPLREVDADAVYAYLRDPVVTALTSYPVVSVPMVEAMIERSLSRWAADELSRWGVALPHDDQLIGTCGFADWPQVHRWAELAFDLAQAHWGMGLMRQAVAAILRWTYQQDRVDRVHAFVRVDNKRSEHLLERSGFVLEGCLRQGLHGAPEVVDISIRLCRTWGSTPDARTDRSWDRYLLTFASMEVPNIGRWGEVRSLNDSPLRGAGAERVTAPLRPHLRHGH